MKKNSQLTKSEYQVMDILWNLPEQGGFVNDLLSRFPEPKPAYTTLSTFLRILSEKGFVQSKKIGKMLWFTPTLSRDSYTESYMENIKDTFFGGSVLSLVSFFAEKERLSHNEIDQLISIIKQGQQ